MADTNGNIRRHDRVVAKGACDWEPATNAGDCAFDTLPVRLVSLTLIWVNSFLNAHL